MATRRLLPLLFLALAFPVGAQNSAPAAIPLGDACSSEIGLLCRGESQAPLGCLDRYRDSATPRCREAIDRALERAASARAAAPADAALPDVDARLTQAAGPVYIHTARQAEGEFVAAEPGVPLSEGDLIRCGDGGSAEIAWDGESVVELSPGSDLSVDSLSASLTQFNLGVGKLVAKIKKLAEGRQLLFRTPTAVAAVRGTELGVSQDEGDAARVGVFDEGKVAVTSTSGDGQVTLTPGQETRIQRGRPPAAPAPLSSFAPDRKAVEHCRERQAAVRKQWQPQSRPAREQLRRRLASKPALKAADLSGVKASQRAKSYPAGRERGLRRSWPAIRPKHPQKGVRSSPARERLPRSKSAPGSAKPSRRRSPKRRP